MRGAAFGRDTEGSAQPSLLEVTTDKLNVRVGPGLDQPRLRAPLARGTRLRALQTGTPPWLLVEPADGGWISGRVSGAYLRPVS